MSLQHITEAYSTRSSRNTVDICRLDECELTESSNRFWIVFIHGGAWRDPRNASTDFEAAQSLLIKSSSSSPSSAVTAKIAGLASVNYRLSRHPDFPSEDPSRTAVHPAHINDVLDALVHLQATYHFGSSYILVGHSAGATLAMQVAMSRAWTSTGPLASLSSAAAITSETSPAIPPLAIVGVCGIYDLPALLESQCSHPVYREFITDAFGEQSRAGIDVWAAASPTHGTYDDVAVSWSGGRHVLLAHSSGDELVGWRQVELMQARLLACGWMEHEGKSGTDGRVRHCHRTVQVLPLSGAHDEVWQKGNELARAVETCLQNVGSLTCT